MKLSIIMPVFNEEKTIKTILQKVMAVRLPSEITAKEIIIVNDASTDQTATILSTVIPAKAEGPGRAGIHKSHGSRVKHGMTILVITHKKNQGKGAALRTGFKKASGDLIVIQDADLEYNPQDFKKLLTPILEKKTEVVYGSRLINYPLILWGKDKTPHPTHWLANHLLSFLTSLLYGQKITDMETCYKMFTKKALKSLHLTASRFDIEPEITAKLLKKGFQILEIPIETKPRSYEEGKKIGWNDGIFALLALIKYRFRN